MSPEEVAFASDGVTIRADLYLPQGDGPHPTIVMAGGWCYVKELRQPDYAKFFVDAGFAALIFDYRNLGASDGANRQHLDPWEQIEDYKNAISFVESRAELDSDRIGVWGISYSGGHALILAAIDPRIKAAVANVPVIDGYQNMWRVHGSERFRLLREAIAEDRRKRFATGEHGRIPMSGDPQKTGLSTWPFQEVKAVFEDLKKTQAPRHEHWNTIASIELLMQYNAMPYVERIHTPTLMITAEGDDITLEDLELKAFNGITTPEKRLVVLPETSHMTLYSNLSRLELAATAARDWFATYLAGAPADRLLGRT